MRRGIFTFAAAVSLLLCAATVVLWLRSYAASNSVRFDHEFHTLSITSVSGRIVLARTNTGLNASARTVGWSFRRNADVPPLLRALSFCGFDRNGRSWAVWIPHGMVIAFTLALPSIWIWMRTKAMPLHRCGKCNYDLTGNTSGTCPGCGTAIPRRSGPS